MFITIRQTVIDVIKEYNSTIEITPEDILLEQPKNRLLGDVYTNSAMLFAKKIGVTPHELAQKIANKLSKNSWIETIRVDGPGFLNIKINNNYWQSLLTKIIKLGNSFSVSQLYSGEKINVEFVSANPTGPLHTGHARNAVFGSVAANLLEKIGYDVTREFYINDQGSQIKYLARSVYLRYIEILGRKVLDEQFTSNMYCGDYIKGVAHIAVEKFGDKFLDQPESEWLETFCDFSIEYILNNIKKDLSDIGVKMDVYTSEKSVCGRNLVSDALKILERNGDIYEGVLPKPKGTVSDDWEERPQTLFKSTKYGDEVDRAIKKSDGTWTYFASDLAYHLDKFQRGFNNMLNIFGADHNGYVTRLKAAVAAISNKQANLEVRLYQLVNFLEDGVPVRMSKRKGTFITLRDVVDRVGKDVTRYMMVSRHHDVMIDFDFKKAIEFSVNNPLFYIQYAHARICSIFRNFESLFNNKVTDEELANADLSLLTDGVEIELIKILTFWKERIKLAAKAIEPHRITAHLHDVAAQFHSLWNKGKTNEHLRFIKKDDINITFARLALLRATQIIISDGLTILGVTPMDEMKPLDETNDEANKDFKSKSKVGTKQDMEQETQQNDEPIIGVKLPQSATRIVDDLLKKI